jgi:hypothetical protein
MSDHDGRGEPSRTLSGDEAIPPDTNVGPSNAAGLTNPPVANVGQHIAFEDTCFALVQNYREGMRAKADTVQRLIHAVSDEQERISPGRC